MKGLKSLFGYPEMSIAYPLLMECEKPYEVMPKLREYILELGKGLDPEEYEKWDEDVWVSRDARVAKSACLMGPTIVEGETEIRHGAYIRGSAIIGRSCIIGNSTEIKNSILFNGVQAPHYNYVGDSILGYKAHMGAGSITSNVKSDKTEIVLNLDGEKIETGLRKLGAMIGDFAEIGCNSVLNPGTVIGVGSTIYPLSSVRGYVPSGHIYKGEGCIVPKTVNS